LCTLLEDCTEVLLDYAGEIPQDASMIDALRAQRPLRAVAPASPGAVAFRELAGEVSEWAIPAGPRGNLEFFVERLVARRDQPTKQRALRNNLIQPLSSPAFDGRQEFCT
jgi:MinD-like ATPase involved in chromosome partitioning or flagellar assembly